ncbi:MAG TPA: hypothetical protein VFU05_20610, partial [Cyclobacteriaceae bacterium]|nr:hypothetical protein [Cyclobacteriaceae bacterium]
MKLSYSIRYTIYLAITGVVTTLLVWYVNQNMQNTYRKNLPYVALGDNLKTKTIKGHLWFEELMAGDQSIDFEKDIVTLFNSSRDLLQDAYDGKENVLGKFEITDEETNALLKEAIIGVENLTTAARERWEFKKNSSTVQMDSVAVDTGE